MRYLRCPKCGQPPLLYWLHTREQFSGIPGNDPKAKILLRSKEHDKAMAVYGCHACNLYGEPELSKAVAEAKWRNGKFQKKGKV